jgi:hypothetical protein
MRSIAIASLLVLAGTAAAQAEIISGRDAIDYVLACASIATYKQHASKFVDKSHNWPSVYRDNCVALIDLAHAMESPPWYGIELRDQPDLYPGYTCVRVFHGDGGNRARCFWTATTNLQHIKVGEPR